MGLLEITMELNILVLFCLEKYDAIFDRIIYLTGLKSDITHVFSHTHNYAKIKIDLDFHLPLEEMYGR